MEVNKEKDIMLAQRFIQEKLSQMKWGGYVLLDTDLKITLPELLAEHVINLEAKGIIKFTANRNGN